MWSHSSARAYITTVAVTEADNIAGGTTHKDFTIQAPSQSTHLACISLEHCDDTVWDMDIVMHNWAIGMAQDGGQDMVEPTKTPDLHTQAWCHST